MSNVCNYRRFCTILYAATISGTVTTLVTAPCCSNFKVQHLQVQEHFTVTNAGNAGGSNKVDYLVVAGGAGGGGGTTQVGGGGGGFRESPGINLSGCWTASPLGSTTPAVALPVSVPASIIQLQ